MAVNLRPVDPPLGVNHNFCAHGQMTLKLQEKVWSLSGDTFNITNALDNSTLLECRGTTLSLHDRKQFTLPGGAPLFSLCTSIISFPHKKFYAEAPDSKTPLFEVKGKFSIGTSKMIATFNDAATRKPIELVVKGDWFDRKANILLGDQVIANISRDFLTAGQIFGGQQTYFVTVAAGVDYALVAAICVCLDEKENEKK